MVRQQHIVIVGAGIVGLSTAYSLLTQGIRNVTILEQEVVDHTRSSSHGFSRLLRFEYGPEAFYSNMVRLSLKRWKKLEYVSGRTLYTPTGLLTLGNNDDTLTKSSYHVVRGMGLPVELLSEESCGLRFPNLIPGHTIYACITMKQVSYTLLPRYRHFEIWYSTWEGKFTNLVV